MISGRELVHQMHRPLPKHTTQHSLLADKEKLSDISECLASFSRHPMLGECLGS